MRHLPSISALLAALLACGISGSDQAPVVVTDAKKETLDEVVEQRKEIEELKQTFQAAREDLHTQRTRKVRLRNGRRIVKDCRIERRIDLGNNASAEADTEEMGR